jgi:hypothetical protein
MVLPMKKAGIDSGLCVQLYLALLQPPAPGHPPALGHPPIFGRWGIAFLGMGTFSIFAPPPRSRPEGRRFTPEPGMAQWALSLRSVSLLPQEGQGSPPVQSGLAISSNISPQSRHMKSYKGMKNSSGCLVQMGET